MFDVLMSTYKQRQVLSRGITMAGKALFQTTYPLIILYLPQKFLTISHGFCLLNNSTSHSTGQSRKAAAANRRNKPSLLSPASKPSLRNPPPLMSECVKWIIHILHPRYSSHLKACHPAFSVLLSISTLIGDHLLHAYCDPLLQIREFVVICPVLLNMLFTLLYHHLEKIKVSN